MPKDDKAAGGYSKDGAMPVPVPQESDTSCFIGVM
jgi:hypothetical protein